MPRPVYIICSDSGAIDHRTNQLSIFNVLESIDVTPLASLPGGDKVPNELIAFLRGLLPVDIRVTAVWMRDDADSADQVFETEVVGSDPGGKPLFRATVNDFSFTVPFHRINIARVKLPGFTSLGVHTVESRLRRKGDTDWPWVQSFPFVVQEKEVPKATEPTSETDKQN
jgi:hypothetical protein